MKLRIIEKCSISVKIKAREDFNHRNILNISRIKTRTQRRDWAKGDVFNGLEIAVILRFQVFLKAEQGVCHILSR